VLQSLFSFIYIFVPLWSVSVSYSSPCSERHATISSGRQATGVRQCSQFRGTQLKFTACAQQTVRVNTVCVGLLAAYAVSNQLPVSRRTVDHLSPPVRSLPT